MDTNLYGELVAALFWTLFGIVEVVFIVLMMSDRFKKAKKALGIAFIIVTVVAMLANWAIAIAPDKDEGVPRIVATHSIDGNNFLVTAAKWSTPAFAKKELEKNPWIKHTIRWVLNHGGIQAVESIQH